MNDELDHQYLHLNESQRRVALAIQTIDRLEATLNRLRDRLYYEDDPT